MSAPAAGHAPAAAPAPVVVVPPPSKITFGSIIMGIIAVIAALFLIPFLVTLGVTAARPSVQYYTPTYGYGPPGAPVYSAPPVYTAPSETPSEGAPAPGYMQPAVPGGPYYHREVIPGYTIVNSRGQLYDSPSAEVEGNSGDAITRAHEQSAQMDSRMVFHTNVAVDQDNAVPYGMPARCGHGCSRCRRSCGMYCRCSGNGPGPCRCR